MKIDSRIHPKLNTKISIDNGTVEEVELGANIESNNNFKSNCGDKIISYLNNELENFSCKIATEKLTDFQKSVFEIVDSIKYGETITYRDVSKRMSQDSLPIAVGQALGSNPFPIVIPCHRVVGKNSVGGYKCGKEVTSSPTKIKDFGGGLPESKGFTSCRRHSSQSRADLSGSFLWGGSRFSQRAW